MSGPGKNKSATFAQGQSVQEREGAAYYINDAPNARPLAPIKGIINPTADMVTNMSKLRNAQNLSGQLADYVIPRPRQPKEVYPSGTPAARGYRDAYGTLHITRGIKPRQGYPGGPETDGMARPMGHDPIEDSPPTDYIKYVEGVDRHPQCQGPLGCSGLCAGLCARQYTKARSAVTSFPKMNNTISSGGVITRAPGEGMR